MRPRELFTTTARMQAVGWVVLIGGLAARFLMPAATPALRAAIPVFLATLAFYVMASMALWTNHRWHLGLLLRAVAAGLIPFGSLLFLRWAKRRRELSGDWRLGRNGSYAYTWNERRLAWSLRQPLLTALLAIVGVVVGAAIFWRYSTRLPFLGS